jgi:SAM-dependent methyltransferase
MAGETPSVEEWNEHLIAFHERYENATSGPMSLMRSAEGETSYQIVARRAFELLPGARAVLDIGCGDGLLLRRIKQTYDRELELVGIDLCAIELERGRAMLGEATFVCGDASATDLGSGRFDAIVAHLAIMIASHQQRILTRARTALRTGGALLMLMEDLPLHPTIGGIFYAGVAVLQATYAGFAPTVPGRERLEEDGRLGAVLAETGFSGISVERHVVGARFTRAEMWAYAQRVYPFGLMEQPVQDRVREAIDDAVTARLEADGCVEITFPLRLVVAQ